MSTNAAALNSVFASLEQLRAMAAGLFAARNNQPARRPVGKGAEAEQLRAFANDFAASDPAFAAELFAAADRHERSCC